MNTVRADPDAGIVGRAAGAADRQDMPAGPRAGEGDMGDDRDQDDAVMTLIERPKTVPSPMKSQSIRRHASTAGPGRRS